jgi:glyoxylase I family protein
MNIRGVHHVAIIVSDYARSRRFYAETLGFRILAETYRADRASYKLDLQVDDGLQLELFSFPDPPARPNRPEACGLRHLAFRVANLDEAIGHLLSREVAVEEARVDPLTGRRFTFCPDPDGLPLEFYES